MAKLPAAGSSPSRLRQLGEADERVPNSRFLFFRSEAGDEIFHPGLPNGSTVWPTGTVFLMTIAPGKLLRVLDGMSFNVPDGRPGVALEFVFTDEGSATWAQLRAKG